MGKSGEPRAPELEKRDVFWIERVVHGQRGLAISHRTPSALGRPGKQRQKRRRVGAADRNERDPSAAFFGVRGGHGKRTQRTDRQAWAGARRGWNKNRSRASGVAAGIPIVGQCRDASRRARGLAAVLGGFGGLGRLVLGRMGVALLARERMARLGRGGARGASRFERGRRVGGSFFVVLRGA